MPSRDPLDGERSWVTAGREFLASHFASSLCVKVKKCFKILSVHWRMTLSLGTVTLPACRSMTGHWN